MKFLPLLYKCLTFVCALFSPELIDKCVNANNYKVEEVLPLYMKVLSCQNPDRAIVGILKKSGIVNHFKGDIRLAEGGSESVKNSFATF